MSPRPPVVAGKGKGERGRRQAQGVTPPRLPGGGRKKKHKAWEVFVGGGSTGWRSGRRREAR